MDVKLYWVKSKETVGKSYCGLQISSQSWNEVHMFWLQPKSATKGDFFHKLLSLIVSSSPLMLPFDVWPSFPSNNVNASLCRFRQDNRTHEWTFSDCNFFPFIFRGSYNYRSLLNEAAYLAVLRRLRSPFEIRDADSKQSKPKIYEKNHLLLRILAVIGRYGPHLMIVMIFVTQDNF